MLYWLVGLGGLMGSLLRYGVAELSLLLPGNEAVLSVYICNVLGSFILAWLLVRAAEMGHWGDPVRLALGTGLLGSFTTFSALSAEALGMLGRGDWITALIYVTSSFIGGWLAAWLGWRLGQPTIILADKGEAEL
ncbi:MAG: CrcB family protein [Paenibacillaceae bacterium]